MIDGGEIPLAWRKVIALIENLWKDEFDVYREAAYVGVLSTAGITPEQAHQAIVSLGGQPGDAWAPSSQEIAREVHRLEHIGTWQWAEEQITTHAARYPLAAWSPEDRVALDQALLDAHHDHGAALVAYLDRIGGPWRRTARPVPMRRKTWAQVLLDQHAGELPTAPSTP